MSEALKHMYNVMNVWRLNEFYRQVGVIDIAGVWIFFLGGWWCCVMFSGKGFDR